eukprot:CAMPEP_0202704798 /NCGR_PEP_ID=MMETSP1385-20130828/17430_1 /ASSEMBLY_ACC=CAM_ASM_000861 /TAXON_ID=933848 /ORGANISM="Elphidium margaritaceum" /LENGTH=145 /DNA_ID=CAMNT_0049362903 /DNA_START=323 /DNA_END=757 /DNA_ORIENTATION=-
MVYSRMKASTIAETEHLNALSCASKLEPEIIAISLWNYGVFLSVQSRYREAADLFKQAMRESPNDIQYEFEYARTLQLIGDDKQYKEQYMEHYANVTQTLTLMGGRGLNNKKFQTDAKIYLYKAVSYKMLNDEEAAEMQFEDYQA